MKAALSKAILRLMGWKIGPTLENPPKCVLCVAPHTSNWDFIIGKLTYTALGRDVQFLIKKEWFTFPFNLYFSWVGGIPVDRNKRTSVTQQMIDEFDKRERMHLAITPEGTRKAVSEWKKGFYHIAKGAKVPILLLYLDFKRKEAGVKEVFYPTGIYKNDIQHIREQYKGFEGRNPEQFVHI